LDACSAFDHATLYRPGAVVAADGFEQSWALGAAAGIHGFPTRAEAEAYDVEDPATHMDGMLIGEFPLPDGWSCAGGRATYASDGCTARLAVGGMWPHIDAADQVALAVEAWPDDGALRAVVEAGDDYVICKEVCGAREIRYTLRARAGGFLVSGAFADMAGAARDTAVFKQWRPDRDGPWSLAPASGGHGDIGATFADLACFDPEFPEHPLSVCRRVVRALLGGDAMPAWDPPEDAA